MKRSLTRFVITSFCFLFFLSISLTETKAQKKVPVDNNWPEWRGQYNSGTVMGGNTPSEFSETKNLNWKIEIPGKGQATPVVWGNQIIVMTAVATDKKPEKVVESAASPMASSSTEFIHQFIVISVDKSTGKINWETVVKEELPAERTHELGSWASNSPVTDGENIFACFVSVRVVCSVSI